MNHTYPRAEALGMRFHALFSAAVNPFPGPLRVDIIINPASGVLCKKKEFLRCLDTFDHFLSDKTRRKNRIEVVRIHTTMFPRHAAEISKEILRRAESADGTYHLILSIGGDGTHQETLENFLFIGEKYLRRFCFFRLPMGTGNDGADTDTFSQSLEILYNGRAGKKAGAVRIKPGNMHPFYAFNIVSLGVDAYITFLSNKLKGVLPGDVYKIIADVATLFYEPVYKAEMMRVSCGKNGEEERIAGRFMLFAVGVSGHRSYGDHKWILPGDENICGIERTSLKNKLKIKKLFYEGNHGRREEVHFWKSDYLIIDYPVKIPMQMDGEAVWLGPENFPLTIEVIPPCLSILEQGL